MLIERLEVEIDEFVNRPAVQQTQNVSCTVLAAWRGSTERRHLVVEGVDVGDLPPGRPSFITRVLGFDSGRFRVWQARRARCHQIAQAPGALLRGSGSPAMNAA